MFRCRYDQIKMEDWTSSWRRLVLCLRMVVLVPTLTRNRLEPIDQATAVFPASSGSHIWREPIFNGSCCPHHGTQTRRNRQISSSDSCEFQESIHLSLLLALSHVSYLTFLILQNHEESRRQERTTLSVFYVTSRPKQIGRAHV